MNFRPRFSAILAVVLLTIISDTLAGDYDYQQQQQSPNPQPKKTRNPMISSTSAVSPSIAALESTTGMEMSNETTPSIGPIMETSSLPLTTGGSMNDISSLSPSIGSDSTTQLLVSSSEMPISTDSSILSSELPISSGSPSLSTESSAISTGLPTELSSIASNVPLETMETESPVPETSTMSENLPTEAPSMETSTIGGQKTTLMDLGTEGPIEPITSGRGKDKGQRTKRTRHPPSVAPTFPPVDFNCHGKVDGYYANPKDKCSSTFYACVGHIAFRMDCSSKDLVYEPETGLCERRQDSFRCSGHRKTSPKPTPRPPQPTVSQLPIDCMKVGDGWHPDPQKKCSHVFYSCSNGHGSKFICPGTMYFDKESKACESFQDVVDCAGKKPATTPKPTVASKPKEKIPVDCVNVPSGPHPDPTKKCSSIYYVCSNGEGWKRECPPGLLYDEKNKWCNYRDEIPACGGGKKTTASSTSTKAPQPSQSSLVSKEFDCSKKDDGSYLPKDKKCSSEYFRCVAGSAYKVRCPHGLFYDVDKDLCERWIDLFVCSGKTPTSPKPSVASLPPKPTEKLPIDCNKNKDGDYPDPEKKCSSIYYTCSGTIGSRRKCPPALFFDKDLKICEAKEHVRDCSGKPRPTKVPTKAALPVTKSPYNCELKSDGNYESGKCSSFYYACIGGSATKVNCPRGLLYDSEMDECGYKDEIPACGGVRPSLSPISKKETTTTKRLQSTTIQNNNEYK